MAKSDKNKQAATPQESAHAAEQDSLPLPPEIAEQIPPNVRAEVTALIMRMSSGHPLAGKITSEHISRALDIAEKGSERQFDYAKGTRWFQLAVFGVVVLVFIFLVVFLADKPTILAPMLTALLGFAAGFGVGKKVS